MTTTYTAKGIIQYNLPIAATVFVATGEAQYALPAWKQSIATGSTQYALSAYTKYVAHGTTQYALSGWTKSIATGSTQYALSGWTKYSAKGNTQYALSIYQSYQATGSAQYALNAYTVWQAAGSAQFALNAMQPHVATGSAQWLLDATEKYYTWMINLTTGAVSKADNYSFNSLSGSMGADSTGIHSLTGTTDNGVAINGFVESGKLDFGVTERKRMVDAYVGVDGGALNLTVTDERTGDNTYKLAATTQLKTTKANLGRGASGKYWKVKLANVAGSSAKVDDIEINIEKLTRKI